MANKKGFTIIELIVVIAIIAVLASIVMVNVTQYIAKSKETAVIADMVNLQTSITRYVVENGDIGTKDEAGLVLTAFWGGDDRKIDPDYEKITKAILDQGFTYQISYYFAGNNEIIGGWDIVAVNPDGQPFFCIDYMGHRMKVADANIVDFDCTKNIN
ncbi:MAG: prepilin-type N-terminal cleavage/methylation domain-containing protein [Candidatus Staskawiczbacteria bacterium]|nr:prepilin-type N-terminal cleavage/methylation domain-containing protein [Candidatus Staskawiczbacteria bacterium]